MTHASDNPTEERSISVLIVEDDPLERESLRKTLETENCIPGFRVRDILPAATCEAALANAERKWFDIVLLDLCLSGNSKRQEGLDIYRALREKGFEGPVIVVSSLKRSNVMLDVSLDLGYDSYLEKPTPANRLLSTIGSRLRMQEAINPPVIRGDGYLYQPARRRIRKEGHGWQQLPPSNSNLLHEPLDAVAVSRLVNESAIDMQSWSGKESDGRG